MSRVRITIKQARGKDRGAFWSVKRDGEYFGAFGFSFIAANSGHGFTRNHDYGYAKAWVAIGNHMVQEVRLERCRYRADADKAARKWFREQDVRGIITSAAKAGVTA